jgi:L-rhamnose mutarotase
MASDYSSDGQIKRVGSVIGLADGAIEEYERIHSSVWPAVIAQIARSNIRNYSIFRLDNLLFSYFEYFGSDYHKDMEKMAEDPATQEWWKICIPLQRQLPDTPENEWWKTIPEVFHCD